MDNTSATAPRWRKPWAPFVDLPHVVALGINCTPPRHVLPLIEAVRSVTAKPLIVYPNWAQGYDRQTQRWGRRPGPATLRLPPRLGGRPGRG